MAKKKREEAHGGHGWFVTFADLMALLVSFFVMLVAFSNHIDSSSVISENVYSCLRWIRRK